MNKEEKTSIVDSLKKHEQDTGSSQVQIALLTSKIKALIEHMKENKKDFATKRGLLKMVHRRKKLLQYLKNTDLDQYNIVVERLEMRK